METDWTGLKETDDFWFNCSKELDCFTKCCADVNISLSPFEVLRLKNRLGMKSWEFLKNFTLSLSTQKQIFPLVLLTMREDKYKTCSLVGKDGCRAYEDRPLPCRVYPLGFDHKHRLKIIADPSTCLGLMHGAPAKIGEWLKTQRIEEFKSAHEEFSFMVNRPEIHNRAGASSEIKARIFMAAYDLDNFRQYIFKNSFLDSFNLKEEQKQKLRQDDEELLGFGLSWISRNLLLENR